MSQGGHGAPPPADIQNKWWAHYLYGVDNGVENLPRAMIVQSTATVAGGGRGAAAPTFYADFPIPGTKPVKLKLAKGGNGVGALAFMTTGKQGIEKLVDDWHVKPGDMALAASSPNRLLYALPILKDSIHLSGTTVVTLKLASSKAAANLSVYLVTLPFEPGNIGSAGQVGVVTRGWADPQNYKALKGAADFTSKKPGEPLLPGKFVHDDLPAAAGRPDHQARPAARLMIFSSDLGFTIHPAPGTELTHRPRWHVGDAAGARRRGCAEEGARQLTTGSTATARPPHRNSRCGGFCVPGHTVLRRPPIVYQYLRVSLFIPPCEACMRLRFRVAPLAFAGMALTACGDSQPAPSPHRPRPSSP